MDLRQVIATRLDAHLATLRVLKTPQIAMAIAELQWVLSQVDASLVRPGLDATTHYINAKGGPVPLCRPDRQHAWLLHQRRADDGALVREKDTKTCRWCGHTRPMDHADKVVAGIEAHHPRLGSAQAAEEDEGW